MALLLLLALVADPPAELPWKQVVDGDVQVFVRHTEGVRVSEIRGDMVMDAAPQEVRAVLIDEDYTRKAPYVGEYRTIETPAPNSWIRYTRLAVPVIEDRDYFIQVTREKDLAPDGSGEYFASWKPWGIDRPPRKGIVRVTINSGYWRVTKTPEGKASVEYYLQFDPGGMIPGWAVNEGNKRILPDVLHGLYKEVVRRREAAAKP